MNQGMNQGMNCNICGGDEFGPGPSGRMSATGKLPYCIKCGSLERHRTARQAWLDLTRPDFADWKVLQFSHDRGVDPAWFGTFEVSDYGVGDYLDLMKINRPTGSYDAVICNHVLEHVQYDNAALQELIRVTKPGGFVFLTFPDPFNRERTVEWAAPREDQHMHWRLYGRDVTEKFARHIPMYNVHMMYTRDPVTEAQDIAYFITKSAAGVARVSQCIADLQQVQGAMAVAG